jgi:hypothetical protein
MNIPICFFATLILSFIIGTCEEQSFAVSNAHTAMQEIDILNASSGSRFLLQSQVCAPGFGSMPEAPVCGLCPPGYFSKGGVGSKCSVCDQFGYAVSSGSSSCTLCPSNQWASFKGSTTSICLCKNNFYASFFREASQRRQPAPTAAEIMLSLSTFSSPNENSCLPCPEGATCAGGLNAPSPRIGREMQFDGCGRVRCDAVCLQVFGLTNRTLSASSFARGIRKPVWGTSNAYPSIQDRCVADARKTRSCGPADVRSAPSPPASLSCTLF